MRFYREIDEVEDPAEAAEERRTVGLALSDLEKCGVPFLPAQKGGVKVDGGESWR